MCGIFFSAIQISWRSAPEVESFSKLCSQLENVNKARGPDAQSVHKLSLNNEDEVLPPVDIEFYASELWLRGNHPIVQPHVKAENVLCWNGEIFEGIEISSNENDGSKIFDLLCTANSPEEVKEIFGNVEGPYAFVFYHHCSRCLYFGRDPLGRRSLLLHKPVKSAPYFLLSSVSAGANYAYDFEELSTEAIYFVDFRLLTSNMLYNFHQCLFDIPRKVLRTASSPGLFAKTAAIDTTIPPNDLPIFESLDTIPEHLVEPVDDLISHLDRSVSRRVLNIPSRFGNDGTARIAVLFSGGIDSSILAFLAHTHIPLSEPIDLLNVAFENPRKLRSQQVGSTSRPRQKIRHINNLGDDPNVYNVPDRVTGILEVEELRRICPGRTWNFIEINVSYAECQASRHSVENLMSPSKTVMDLSLALALYFASRGRGRLQSADESQPEYISGAKVLLNGLGSDELLGGYGRHRTAYYSGGWEAVILALQEELVRIPSRNLGRDDRVISSHGKEVRHPFLSLSLVSFLASLPVHYKTDPRLEVGIGDKFLLRLAARKLGLREASERKKRAMQFGSHSARMDVEQRS